MRKCLLALLAALPLLSAKAQNLGFEATPAASPPTNWTAVTGTWTVTTDPNQVRTGAQAMTITNPAATGTTMGTVTPYVTVTGSSSYLVTIAWGKASDATNGLFYLGYRLGTANTLNPSTTSSGQPANLNDVTWSRITSVSAATVAAGNYGTSIRAFRTSGTPTTSIYIDDVITYESAVAQPDLTAPDMVSGLTESSFILNWTNGNDAGTVQSGHDGVVIVRADGTSALAPTLNDQAMYSPGGGASGVSSFTQNGDIWTVVANLSAGTTTFTDATAISGVNYTYAVFNRDRAYNYSPASAVTTAPPTNMVYVSSDVTQVTGNVAQGATDAAILRVQVSTSGSLNPLSVTSFDLSTAGSTSAADISAAKVYYTGNSTNFNSSNLFGTQAAPSGSFTISGSQALFPGNNYFWLVYDVSPTATGCNVLDGENNGITLSSGPVVPATTSPAGDRTIRTSLNGVYSIDPLQASSCLNFQSFSEAVTILNTFGTSGNVTFNVAANYVYAEPPLTVTNMGSTGHNIIFQNAGGGTTPLITAMSGTGTNDAAFTLNGSSNVTFDGIDIMDDAGNTTATTQMEYGFRVINSSATTGSSFNTIRNSKITLNRTNTATIGILQSASTTGGGVAATSLDGANHNNTYEDVTVENSYQGIHLLGTAGFPDSSNVITSVAGQTTVGSTTPGDIGGGTVTVAGIRADNQRNVTIAKTIVRNLAHAGTSTLHGIYLNNTSTTTDYGNALVYNNMVYDIARTTTTSVTGTMHGIRIDVSTTATATVYNNIVHSITSVSPTTATANQIVRGITHNLSGAGNASFYHNSVNIYSTAANLTSVAFWKGGAGSALLNNNIFSNESPAQTGTPKHFAAYVNAGTIANSSSYNLYWSSNANGFLGYAGADRSGLWQWIGAVSGPAPSNPTDAGSAFANPFFVSTSDLNFGSITPAYLSGTPLPLVTTDFSGAPRNSAQPTIGAIENALGIDDQSPPAITNVVIANGVAPSVSADITENSTAMGPVVLWYRPLGGTTFTDISPDIIPVSGSSGTYTWNASFATLPAGQQYEFYIAARDAMAPGVNIALSPAPTSGFTSFAPSDPPNFATNPDAAANKWAFTKTSLLPGGTYTIGASGTYLKLTNAVNALNSSSVLGNVTFVLLADYDGTTGETFPITINPVSTVAGPWTVTFRPDAGVTARVTSGTPAAGIPMIHLNGADNIVFDGRPVGGTASEWLLRSTGGTSAAVTFSNDATNDTLRYLTIESGNTSTTSGTVHISTTNETGGNDNIMISNNRIRNRSDAAGIPINAIYSAGTAAALNNNNSVIDNEIFNFTTNGISVTNTGNGDTWNISGNSFYYNDATAASGTQTSINFASNASGNTINGNYIGGTAAQAGGTAWLNSGANLFLGILTTVGSSSATSISGNVVKNISKTATGAASFAGIRNTLGLAHITNNTVGDAGVSNSIANSGSSLTYGIDVTNTDNTVVTLIDDNLVAGMTATGTAAAAKVIGIRFSNSGTAAGTITDNVIHTLSTTSAAAGLAATDITAVGLYAYPTGGYPVSAITISGNTIYDVTAANTGTAATIAAGMVLTNFSGTVTANRIHTIKNLATSAAPTYATATGMFVRFMSGNLVANNMIALGDGVSNNAQVNGVTIAGGNGGVQNYVHNSIYIYNTTNSPAQSAAFMRGDNAQSAVEHTVVLLDNILYNNISTPGNHYAIRNFTAVPATGWPAGSSDYNVLFTQNPATVGQWGSTPYSLPDWQFNTANDLNSRAATVNFVSPATADLHVTGASLGDMQLAGTYLIDVPADYDGETRVNPPYIGADENVANPLPVALTALSARAEGNDALVNWETGAEENLSYYEVEAAPDAVHFTKAGKVVPTGSSSQYTFRHVNAKAYAGDDGSMFYRLKMVEKNGTVVYSGVVKANFSGNTTSPVVNVYPNPFGDRFAIELSADGGVDYSYTITDMTGKRIVSKSGMAEGSMLLEETSLQNYPSGFYLLDLTLGGKHYQYKLSKK